MHVSLLDSGYLQLGKLTLAEYQYAKYLRKMAYTYLIMRGKAYYQLQFPSPFHLNKRGSFVTSLSNKLLSKYFNVMHSCYEKILYRIAYNQISFLNQLDNKNSVQILFEQLLKGYFTQIRDSRDIIDSMKRINHEELGLLLSMSTDANIWNIWRHLNEWLEKKNCRSVKYIPFSLSAVPNFVHINTFDLLCNMGNNSDVEVRNLLSSFSDRREAYHYVWNRYFNYLPRRFGGNVACDGYSVAFELVDRIIIKGKRKRKRKDGNDTNVIVNVEEINPLQPPSLEDVDKNSLIQTFKNGTKGISSGA